MFVDDVEEREILGIHPDNKNYNLLQKSHIKNDIIAVRRDTTKSKYNKYSKKIVRMNSLLSCEQTET